MSWLYLRIQFLPAPATASSSFIKVPSQLIFFDIWYSMFEKFHFRLFPPLHRTQHHKKSVFCQRYRTRRESIISPPFWEPNKSPLLIWVCGATATCTARMGTSIIYFFSVFGRASGYAIARCLKQMAFLSISIACLIVAFKATQASKRASRTACLAW